MTSDKTSYQLVLEENEKLLKQNTALVDELKKILKAHGDCRCKVVQKLRALLMNLDAFIRRNCRGFDFKTEEERKQ